jgi:adenylate kinase
MGAIVVTGVPGVGKTTVMTAAAEAKGLKVVVYGSEMFRVAKARGFVKDRDEMRRLAPEVQREVQRAAAEAIATLGEVIVDTHCTVQTPKGFLPGLPAWVLEALKPSTIVLVEADPKEIHGRRSKDSTRARDADSEPMIQRHQELNRAAAMAYATLTGATVAIVYNHDGKVEDAIQQILPVVQ